MKPNCFIKITQQNSFELSRCQNLINLGLLSKRQLFLALYPRLGKVNEIRVDAKTI
jgi:hypothetical protein